jgi:hypothetical protein
MNKIYMLEEYKRRFELKKLKDNVQLTMPDKYKTMWWCKDECLDEIRKQFIASSNHCVVDDFLGSEMYNKTSNEVKLAQELGLLEIEGRLTFLGREENIRTDTLGWLDCTSQPDEGIVKTTCSFDEDKSKNKWENLHYLLQRIETIVSELGDINCSKINTENLNKNEIDCINDINLCKSRSKSMVTLYSGKDDDSSRYTKHYDNGNLNGRKLTAIYYMNDNWKRKDGGALRLYTQNIEDKNSEEIYCDVEPISDRLVLFYSDKRTPHEVLPTHKDRFAVTVWFFDNIEKMASNKRQKEEEKTKTI